MNLKSRSLVLISFMSVIGAANAQITITPSADVVVSPTVPNQAEVLTPTTQFAFGKGTYSDSGQINYSSTTGLYEIDLHAYGVVTNATVSLNVWYGNASQALGTTIYTSSTSTPSTGLTTNAEYTVGNTSPLFTSGPETLYYDANYTSSSTMGFGMIHPFYVDLQANTVNPPPPVPEPASMMVFGLGLMGLVVRNRRK